MKSAVTIEGMYVNHGVFADDREGSYVTTALLEAVGNVKSRMNIGGLLATSFRDDVEGEATIEKHGDYPVQLAFNGSLRQCPKYALEGYAAHELMHWTLAVRVIRQVQKFVAGLVDKAASFLKLGRNGPITLPFRVADAAISRQIEFVCDEAAAEYADGHAFVAELRKNEGDAKIIAAESGRITSAAEEAYNRRPWVERLLDHCPPMHERIKRLEGKLGR